jgi:hypothetical protein
MTQVLKGIRVLDFGRYIAGPFCGTLLADMGAEVIRIEKVDGSEDRYLAPISDTDDGGTFMQLARNKKGLTLNPMKPEGREIVKKLVATADVVIANLPPDTLAAMGLDYDSLKAVKPDIILTMISAFGRGGPYSNRVGFDGLGQAMSGAMYLSGTPDQPVKAWPPFVDFGTASFAAFGTMAVPKKIVQINVMRKSGPFSLAEIQRAAKEVDLHYGEMGIYHRETAAKHTLFSMASMVEPGTFPQGKKADFATPGLTLFAQIPGPRDGIAVFSDMLMTAERMATMLDAVLYDDTRSKLTRQSIDHTRDSIAEHLRKVAILKNKR